MGRGRYRIVEDSQTYFMTSSTLGRLPLYSVPGLAQIVLHRERRIRIHGRGLMETQALGVFQRKGLQPKKRAFRD